MRYWLHHDQPLDASLERRAVASYYGLISFCDALIGRLLQAIAESPLAENTVVIYVSDHGEMAGHHGIWQKQCFYEPAVRVPMILRVPGAPAGLRVEAGTSLMDLLPTLLEIAGQPPPPTPGRSLLPAVRGEHFEDQPIFSEYHTVGSATAGYMVRLGRWKYIHYVDLPEQLFDLQDDPDEICDRAGDPTCRDELTRLRAQLHQIVDPQAVHEQALASQALAGPDRLFHTRATTRYGPGGAQSVRLIPPVQ